jgi:hypothetical protein
MADLPPTPKSTSATFPNVTAILASDSYLSVASQKLQANLDAIQNWLKKWKIKANKPKSVYVTFTT